MKLLDKGMRAYQRLLNSLKPHGGILAAGLLGAMCGGLIDSGLAWLVKPIVNKGFVVRDMHFIKWIPAILITAILMRSFVNFVADYCITRVGRTLTMEYRQKIFRQLLRLPTSYFDQQTSGKLLSTVIYNVEQIAEASTNALLTAVKEGFLLAGMLTVMLVLSWKLTLFFCIAGPVVGWILKKNSQRLRGLSHQVQDSVAEVTHITEEAIEGHKVIRTFNGETYESQRFNTATNQNRQRELKVTIANSLGSSGIQMALTIPTAAILYFVTSAHVPALALSAGTFAAFMAAMLSVERPFRRLTRVNSAIQKGIAAAQSIFALLDQTVEKDTGTLPIEKIKGDIAYENVSFAYPNTQTHTLNDINFKAEAGKTIALIGHSGSGKSTLINLLPRFYDLTQGKITLDGQDISLFKLADLRQQFAIVSQHVTLFNTSILDNIRYGQFEQVSDKQVINAAKAAHAMEFIEKLPEGLNTQVGENGVLLSGGQRQRIAIARALLKKAPILILDEATASLDSKSEQYIQTALETLIQQSTTLVIAHRLSTVEHADCILVLEHGCIVEQGKHEELLAKKGHYAELYTMQFNHKVATASA